MTARDIFCCRCDTTVEARLTDGKEIYPRYLELAALPFWRCDTCGNYVGCHHKTKDRIRPLGVIPTPEIRAMRGEIHAQIDLLTGREGGPKRREVYAFLSGMLGKEFHAGEIRRREEAVQVLAWLKNY